MFFNKLASVLMLGALALGLAACGSAKNDNGAEQPDTAKQEIVIKAASWEFDQPEYVVPKDTPVKITLENTKGAHGIEVDGADIKLGPGRESTVVTLAAGTYEFRCNIMCGSGHNKMVSKLVVQ